MSPSQGYVCAFRGRRDSYQAPIALAERDRLDAFITDAYFTGPARLAAGLLPSDVRHKALSRRDDRLPDKRIRSLWLTTLAERAMLTAGVAPARIYDLLDDRFSLAAARQAAKRRSNLFLYSPYAWPAFAHEYEHQPRKLLFQYHPHIHTEERLLADDAALYPDIFHSSASRLENVLASPARLQSDSAWSLADATLCASSFTRQSLIDAGAESRSIVVVPYGVDMPADAPPQRGSRGPFHALFVGSGTQRKGLHHLLLAWGRAKLPSDSTLTIVCRVLDTRIEPLLKGVRGVQLRRGVSAAELSSLYSSASLFVMPSLVEGFGQVYLEALSYGLPVLGTTNTCLPDIGTEDDGVFVTPAGDVSELAMALERISAADETRTRRAARACAAGRSWDEFRAGVGALL